MRELATKVGVKVLKLAVGELSRGVNESVDNVELCTETKIELVTSSAAVSTGSVTVANELVLFTKEGEGVTSMGQPTVAITGSAPYGADRIPAADLNNPASENKFSLKC